MTIGCVSILISSTFCKKINSQFNVMLRFRKLISKDTLLRLHKAFIMPHFNYCSSVSHFCGARNTEKIGGREGGREGWMDGWIDGWK